MHILLVVLIIFPLTEFDREMVSQDWIPERTSIFIYLAGMFVLFVYLLISSRSEMWQQLVALRRNYRFFAEAFLFLLTLSLLYWIIKGDRSLTNAVYIFSPFIVCLTAGFLAMVPEVRRSWRIYLWAAFLIFSGSVMLDALGFDSRPAGFSADRDGDPNVSAYICVFLSVPLLNYRRFSFLDLAVLFISGFIVFITLSRGGALVYALLALSYLAFVFARDSDNRLRLIVMSVMTYAALFVVISMWIQFTPYIENRETGDKMRAFWGRTGWFEVRLKASNVSLIEDYRKRYMEDFGRITPTPDPVAAPSDSAGVAVDNSGDVDDVPFIREEGEYVYIDSPRMVRLQNALEAIRISPLVGYGNRYSSGRELPDGGEGVSAHNMYLASWIDFGLPGFIGFVVLLLGAFWSFFRKKYWPAVFLIGMIACWSMLSHTIFEHRGIFVMLGLMMSLALVMKDDASNTDAGDKDDDVSVEDEALEPSAA